MVQRPFWIQAIESAWKRRPVVWLSGVRRSGKTTLSQSLEKVEYFDCERPGDRRQMEDPEAFLERMKGKRIVLDEVHRLPNPSELLKIAADHFPGTRVLATGSSMLQASTKFKDTLAGRKAEVWLTPMMSADWEVFGNADLEHRMIRGGLPPFFLAQDAPGQDYQDWMDAYWAKDIQELFRLERRAPFKRLLELLLLHSGGLFEASAYAGPCEISRPTVTNYLHVLEATRVAHIIRPFSLRRSSEIISAPKVYAFDTGFVHAFRGWQELRPEDKGVLWEHLVLNEIQSRAPGLEVRYWRDKHGNEVDFILLAHGRKPVAVECKWSSGGGEPAGMKAFRAKHPDGENWMVCHDTERPFQRKVGGHPVEVMGLGELARRLL